MTREQVVHRVRAELAQWAGDEPDVAVPTIADVVDLQQALDDACESCLDELKHEESA